MAWFKYAGKETRILALHDALRAQAREAEGRLGMHPTQLSRETGFDMFDVSERLQECPELFVKLPRSDGVTRYRLTSAASAMNEQQVTDLIARRARTERMQITAVTVILACLGLILLLTVIPATSLS